MYFSYFENMLPFNPKVFRRVFLTSMKSCRNIGVFDQNIPDFAVGGGWEGGGGQNVMNYPRLK